MLLFVLLGFLLFESRQLQKYIFLFGIWYCEYHWCLVLFWWYYFFG